MSSGQKAAYEEACERHTEEQLAKVAKLTPDQIYRALVEFNRRWHRAAIDNIPLTSSQRDNLERAQEAIAELGITTREY